MLKFTAVSGDGPSVAHAATAVDSAGRLYLHGGASTLKNTTPEHVTYRCDPKDGRWIAVSSDGPVLSHSACYMSGQGRYMNVIGGWDGRNRLANVETFDTHHDKWVPSAPVVGFPVGGGLSSHSCTRLRHDGALVIGRLGGLRMQRRHSAVLEVRGSYKSQFTITNHEIEVESRSGHSALPAGTHGQGLALVGGRMQQHGSMPVEYIKFANISTPKKAKLPVDKLELRPTSRSGKEAACSRRYQIAVPLKDGHFMLHGGEGFDNMNLKASDPRRDILLWQHTADVSTKADVKTCDSNWSFVNGVPHNGCNGVPRLSGHSAQIVDGKVLVFGGFTDNWQINTKMYKIEFEKIQEEEYDVNE